MRLSAPADSSPALHKFARRIVEADKEARTTPFRLQEYATAADLPPAADWRAGQVYVADIEMTAFSTGTIWKRTDTGATL